MPFGVTVKVLEELLPLESALNSTQVRKTLHRISERMEGELGQEQGQYIEGCPRDWASLPRPDAPLNVAIDAGYVRGRDGDDRKAGSFEVIAEVSNSEEKEAKCFGFVNNYDEKPRCLLYTN